MSRHHKCLDTTVTLFPVYSKGWVKAFFFLLGVDGLEIFIKPVHLVQDISLSCVRTGDENL